MKTLLMGCGCLTLALIGVLIVGVGGLGWLGWQTVANQPADAKRDVLFPANRALIERIDALIAANRDLAELSKQLADAIPETQVIYLHIEDKTTNWKQDAIKRQTWDGQSISTVNGAGWGTLFGKFEHREIRIIESHQATHSGTDITYTLYLEVPPKVEK